MLDNHDSFTWNLVQYLRIANASVDVRLNDQITVDEVLAKGYDRIVISPGPGRPEDAGISLDLVRAADGAVPILGVCMGHQAMACAWGGEVVQAPPVHGKTSEIHHDGIGLFEGLPSPFIATRYHSLVINRNSLPSRFEVSAWTADGTIMGIRDRSSRSDGVQFHPESILTKEGMNLLGNFLKVSRSHVDPRAVCTA